MYDLLKYLNSVCKQSCFLQNNRLLFEIDGFDILIDVEVKDSINYDFYQINFSNDYSGLLEHLSKEITSIKKFAFSNTEYLGARTDLIKYNKPTSISKFLLYLEKYLNKKFEFLIPHYSLETNYGLDGSSGDYCAAGENYTGEIIIPCEIYGDVNNLKQIIKEIKPLSEFNIPSFYWDFFQKLESINETEISILITNTKTRRLGYFKILSEFFKNNSKVNKNKVNRKFENYSIKFNIYLETSDNNKGIINESRTGNSAKPYLELSKTLGFSNEINNIFLTGKNFKVYQVITDKIKSSNNPFNLNVFDKLFFLETILEKDFFYLSSLLELIFVKGELNYSWLRNNFQNFILFKLRERIINEPRHSKLVKQLKKIENRIDKWENAPKYLEHILLPRLNWLLDLELLEANDKIYRINEKSAKLVEHFCYWNDINYNQVIDPTGFLKLFYIDIFEDCFRNLKNNKKKDVNYINGRIKFYIKDSFNLFSTLAPNRVTSSQAVNYTKYSLYLFEDIKVGFRYIENFLNSEANENFIYKYQSQYQDGYIQLKNKI